MGCEVHYNRKGKTCVDAVDIHFGRLLEEGSCGGGGVGSNVALQCHRLSGKGSIPGLYNNIGRSNFVSAG